MSGPIFAAASALPDRAFRDLPDLARWLSARRDRCWPGASFVLRAAVLGRDALPARGCIAVRVRTAAGVRLLGYALVDAPGGAGAIPDLSRCLRAALDVADDARRLPANAVRHEEEPDAA